MKEIKGCLPIKRMLTMFAMTFAVCSLCGQIIVNRTSDTVSIDFRSAMLSYEAKLPSQILTLEKREQTTDGIAIYSTTCVAVYKISQKNGRIKVKRSVLDKKSEKGDATKDSITTNFTEYPCDMALSGKLHLLNSRFGKAAVCLSDSIMQVTACPISLLHKKDGTQISIDKLFGAKDIESRIFSVTAKVNNAKETMTYSTTGDSLFFCNLQKIDTQFGFNFIIGRSRKEERHELHEQIFILKINAESEHSDYNSNKVTVSSAKKFISENAFPAWIKRETSIF